LGEKRISTNRTIEMARVANFALPVETCQSAASSAGPKLTKSHGKRVAELMSQHIVSASEDAPRAEIAALLERNRIKRVPIIKDGKLVGIVSRANII
jgi:CBS domain-containing protein